ncbi:hypothetical protein MesoLjLc_22180 [Mesorhizobium sp. L-8-10]|uniref:hypothetical protein n=1 Tax=Mesorhizobium sp. L-8-10 TaxID=2744523 RepID=UPI0019269817|nr:hypothetical protein [Mesorhizobium sp. L-8-10]BCH30288.1 hypothetical protein MesoLjLc_22180 [Mesorhizobium sp. L-8-10]
MHLIVGDFCPLIGKDCIQLQCKFFCKIQGKDTNTGKDVEEWNCSIAFLPLLLIENSGQQRQTGAAVESFRNEMVKANETSHQVLLARMRSSTPMIES